MSDRDPNQSWKDDQHKIPLTLISPYFKEAVADVLAFGAKKYRRWNWIITGFTTSRLRDAIDRHLAEFDKRNDNDPESGLMHLAHAACMLMFLIHQQMLPNVYGHLDDRPDFLNPKASDEATA